MTRLQVSGIGVRRSGVDILRDVDLTVDAGERHALLGLNGAGKTTLLASIAGQIRPHTGRILIDGRDTTGLAPERIARVGVGRTWQHPALCDTLTAVDNLQLPLWRAGHHRPAAAAVDLLERAGLTAVADRCAGALSYGQRRRLELACALATGHRLLLLDEPSAGLSPTDLAALVTLLTTLPPDVAVVLAEHDVSTVEQVAHRASVIADGAIIATCAACDAIDLHRAERRDTSESRVTERVPVNKGPEALDVDQITVSRAAAQLTRVSLTVPAGAIVGLTGPNGAGKSTLLDAIAGHAAASCHRISVAGRRVEHLGITGRARAGLGYVPQGRRLFPGLTVAEHLQLAAGPRRHRHRLVLGRGSSSHRTGDTRDLDDPAELIDRIPLLAGRLDQLATSLSGGEQQMLAVARALSAAPRCLLLDEPFEGLADAAVRDLTRLLGDATRTGIGCLVAENRTELFRSLESDVFAVQQLPN